MLPAALARFAAAARASACDSSVVFERDSSLDLRFTISVLTFGKTFFGFVSVKSGSSDLVTGFTGSAWRFDLFYFSLRLRLRFRGRWGLWLCWRRDSGRRLRGWIAAGRRIVGEPGQIHNGQHGESSVCSSATETPANTMIPSSNRCEPPRQGNIFFASVHGFSPAPCAAKTA